MANKTFWANVLVEAHGMLLDILVMWHARAKIRVMVRRILKKHGYPPDLQDEAVKTVLAQAELLCADWV